ncbi:MAG TPA: universal stress protein [Chloroflexota bacterium]|nr:universal stress protein [Chloroflexota bacterium]
MVRSILTPLDGSSAAEDALPVAASLASRLGARLSLVRPVSARSRPSEGPSGVRAARMGAAHAYLEECAHRLHERYPQLHVVVAAPIGLWCNAVLDIAALERADLVVAATRLAGDGIAHVQGPVGSGALALSRHADLPLLFVPAQAGAITGVSTRPLRVLVPLDGSPTAEAILPLVVHIGATLPLRATVLHVIPAQGFSPAGATYCERVARWLEEHGVPAQVEIRSGSAVEEIGAAALEHADVLALGLPEALPWRFGHSAERLLRTARVPVLQLRSRRTEVLVSESGITARTVVPALG